MKRLAKLGSVEFTLVEDESIKEDASMTEHPVESGQNVSDHIKQEALLISVSGIMTGEDALAKFNKLKSHRDNGELLYYQGKEFHKNMAILNIGRNYNKQISNGFYFDLELKQPRISTAKKVTFKISSPKVKTSSNRYKTSKGYMSSGDKNNAVKNLQADLNQVGFTLATDGIFGPATQRAVRSFQKKNKLKVDGLAGPATQKKLNELMNNKSASKKVQTRVKTKSNKGKQQTKTKR